jgi:hypothetical protein
MKRSLIFIITAGALLITLVVALAATNSENPNDPAVNPNANACYTGGSMEGKCKQDEQLWIAGWYAIRYQHGIITADQIPDPYKWLINEDNNNIPETTPEPSR